LLLVLAYHTIFAESGISKSMSSSSAGKKDEANAATSLKELQSSIEVLVSYCKE
jgi:hypothetical protein